MIKRKKSQKQYPADYNLLIVQDLWHEPLSNFVNNFDEGIHGIKLNKDNLIKNGKLAELKAKIATAFLYTQTYDRKIRFLQQSL